MTQALVVLLAAAAFGSAEAEVAGSSAFEALEAAAPAGAAFVFPAPGSLVEAPGSAGSVRPPAPRTPLAPACARSLRSMPEVTRCLSEAETAFAAAGDPRAVFAGVYRLVVLGVEELLRKGRFRRPGWVVSLTVGFGELYRQALADQASGAAGSLAPSWRVALEEAPRDRVPEVLHVLLSMNAHVTRDLPLALAASGSDFGSSASQSDFKVIGGLFSGGLDAYWEAMRRLSAPTPPPVVRRIESFLAERWLAHFRRKAWEDALALSAGADEGAQGRLVARLEREALARARCYLVMGSWGRPAGTPPPGLPSGEADGEAHRDLLEALRALDAAQAGPALREGRWIGTQRGLGTR
ncbi:MAG: hypothetical protein HY554_15000 [Elusimicrobia bacterium]|nr:hypothetical protein [Elusimicrobiota bacterium]